MKKVRSLFAVLLSVSMVSSMALCAGAEEKSAEDYSGTLVVYSPHDTDPLNAGIAAFEEAYPNVTVELVADGTGNLLNRIAAEADAPLADVLWGGGADSLAAYKDYFQPYEPSCIDLLDSSLYDPDYYWIGESPLPMVFLVNTDLVAEEDIPSSWADLADSKWEGQIVMADPASSGSAFTQLCTMLMLYGEESDDYAAGWDFVASLMDNLVITSSSSSAHKDVDAGEYAIGITLEKAAVQYDTSDSGHLAIVYPEDGTSAVPDGVAIVKDCPNQELAELFVEFVLSAECQTSQNVDYGRRPIRSDVEAEGLPTLDSITLMDYNFDYAANNKSDIIDLWKDLLVE
ncbi:MAG: extracellular solute-binding protein [Lachnospiraceae bacterium]|nr:extracellular solute-binding protein [Lachnospiraceae bacterium]